MLFVVYNVIVPRNIIILLFIMVNIQPIANSHIDLMSLPMKVLSPIRGIHHHHYPRNIKRGVASDECMSTFIFIELKYLKNAAWLHKYLMVAFVRIVDFLSIKSKDFLRKWSRIMRQSRTYFLLLSIHNPCVKSGCQFCSCALKALYSTTVE